MKNYGSEKGFGIYHKISQSVTSSPKNFKANIHFLPQLQIKQGSKEELKLINSKRGTIICFYSYPDLALLSKIHLKNSLNGIQKERVNDLISEAFRNLRISEERNELTRELIIQIGSTKTY
jgi:hypothetical protein